MRDEGTGKITKGGTRNEEELIWGMAAGRKRVTNYIFQMVISSSNVLQPTSCSLQPDHSTNNQPSATSPVASVHLTLLQLSSLPAPSPVLQASALASTVCCT